MSRGQVQSRYKHITHFPACEPDMSLAIPCNPERDQEQQDALLSLRVAYSDHSRMNSGINSQSALDEAIARSLQDQFDLEARFFAAPVPSNLSRASYTPRSLIETEHAEPSSSEIVELLEEEDVLDDELLSNTDQVGLGPLVGPVACRRCRAPLPVHPWDPLTSKGNDCSLQLTCSFCHHKQCRGCLRSATSAFSPSSSCSSLHHSQPPQLECCPQIRTVALFEVLSAFDENYLQFLCPSNARDYRARQRYLTNMLKPIGDPARKWEQQTIDLLTWLRDILEMQAEPHCPVEIFQTSFIMELFDWFIQEEHQPAVFLSHHRFYSSIIVTMSALIKAGYTSLFTSPYSRIKGSAGLRSNVAGESIVQWEDQTERPPLVNDPGELHRKRATIMQVAQRMTLPQVAGKLHLLASDLSYLLLYLAEY